MLNSARVELPSHPVLIEQLVGLERRVARNGRESISERPGSRDDVANAVAGALVLAAGERQKRKLNLSAGVAAVNDSLMVRPRFNGPVVY